MGTTNRLNPTTPTHSTRMPGDHSMPSDRPAGPGARLLAIGGGKGGVGKTFVTANLAAALARLGKRVVVVDVDLDGANLHTCLGVPSPRRSLADFVSEREDDLGKLLVDTPLPNLKLIGATHANLADAQPSHLRRVRLVRGLRQLDADIVLLDLGAGAHASVLDYFLVSDDGILVLQPEPTSVENAYSFLRAAFYRRMRLAMVGHGVRQLITTAMDQRNERGIRTPLDLLREIEATDTAEARRFVDTMRVFRPRVVVNGARTAEDVKLGFAVSSVCKKYFGIDAEYLGYVNYDDEARRSVSMRRPIVDLHTDADVSIYLQRIARKLIGLPSANAANAAQSSTGGANHSGGQASADIRQRPVDQDHRGHESQERSGRSPHRSDSRNPLPNSHRNGGQGGFA
ncbi:MAG TPA: MinD/ParA family protein [Myxococcales bacterium]|nr:MinD/ParA family protein [Myxococcales bacterium]